jgi:hypothetical protein
MIVVVVRGGVTNRKEEAVWSGNGMTPTSFDRDLYSVTNAVKTRERERNKSMTMMTTMTMMMLMMNHLYVYVCHACKTLSGTGELYIL